MQDADTHDREGEGGMVSERDKRRTEKGRGREGRGLNCWVREVRKEDLVGNTLGKTENGSVDLSEFGDE